jgi:uncharacterized protein
MNRAVQAAGPVSETERIDLVDILRGFALLGILLVNFQGAVGERLPGLDATLDRGLDLLIADSFYPLFSFLFGLGFAVQLLRSRGTSSGVSLIFLRRLLVLFLIGTAHVVLIWAGDILVTYSLLGLFLLPAAKLPPRGVLAMALVLFAFQLNPDAVLRRVNPDGHQEMLRSGALVAGVWAEEERIERDIRFRKGIENQIASTYAADIKERWNGHGMDLSRFTQPLAVLSNDILVLFLVGMYVGRRRLLHNARQHRHGLALTAGLGLVAAIGGNLVPVPNSFGYFSSLAWSAANYGLTAFYIAALALMGTSAGPLARGLRVLAPVGRMGLTNYLMQSLVMTWPFLAYGLGFDRPSTTIWLLLNLAFFCLVQIPLSALWMSRFQYGPAEWLWRSLTYGVWQPMRRGAAVEILRDGELVLPAAQKASDPL